MRQWQVVVYVPGNLMKKAAAEICISVDPCTCVRWIKTSVVYFILVMMCKPKF